MDQKFNLETEIEDLGLSVMTTNALWKHGVKKVGDLIEKSPAQILRMPNIGRKSIKDIRLVLSGMGYRLDGSPKLSIESQSRGVSHDETPTLRDQFAMAALDAAVDMRSEYAAEHAYKIADAMLEARKK